MSKNTEGKYKDFNNKRYRTKTERNAAIHLPKRTYNNYLKRIKSNPENLNKTEEEQDALAIETWREESLFEDYQGNFYKSKSDRNKKIGIENRTLEIRIQKLREKNKENNIIMTDKELDKLAIQEYQKEKSNIESTDHMGNTFSSNSEMCKKWRISRKTYYDRRKAGLTIEESLTIPKKMSLGEYKIKKVLNELNIEYIHDKTIKNVFKDLGLTKEYNAFKKEYQENLKKVGINWSKTAIDKLRYDFALVRDNNVFSFIEFDGEQHFAPVAIFIESLQDFLLKHNKDEIKDEISEFSQIPLLRIRYDQADIIKPMIQDLLKNPKKYIHEHNTYLSNDEYWSIFEKAKIEEIEKMGFLGKILEKGLNSIESSKIDASEILKENPSNILAPNFNNNENNKNKDKIIDEIKINIEDKDKILKEEIKEQTVLTATDNIKPYKPNIEKEMDKMKNKKKQEGFDR